MSTPQQQRSQILQNYPHEKHFLQIVHLPAFDTPGKNFLYMKNHKAACTTVLATLLEQLQALKGTTYSKFDMKLVHWPPKSLLLMGPKRLAVSDALEAMNNPEVFKFTIVRDPLARTVSAYADKIHGGLAQKKRLMQYLGRPVDSDITLSEFLDLMAQDPQARDLDRHWREQRKEISYDFIPFDFIGDVSDLNGAMAEIVRTVFRQEPKMRDTRISLDHRSNSKKLIDEMTRTDQRNIDRAYEIDFAMYEEIKNKFKTKEIQS